MKNEFLVALVLVLFFVLLFYHFMATRYVYRDFNDLLFLTRNPSLEEVRAHFKKSSEEIVHVNEPLLGKGWKIPARKISNYVLIYVRGSGLKYYIYIDQNNEVEYVFTSSS